MSMEKYYKEEFEKYSKKYYKAYDKCLKKDLIATMLAIALGGSWLIFGLTLNKESPDHTHTCTHAHETEAEIKS